MRTRIIAGLFWMAGGCLWSAAGAEPIPKHVLTLLENHCTDCHDSSTRKGDVNLEFAEVDWNSAKSALLMERIHRVLEKGEMPPPKKKRPPVSETREALEWLDQGLTQKVPPAATGFRRLTRAEYLSTIQRLFLGNFQLPLGFPEDTRSHGFENVAESLMVSRPLMEAYGESAALVADRIFRLPRKAIPFQKVISMREMSQKERDFGGTYTTFLRGEAMRFALQGERAAPSVFEAPVSGIYRLHLKASAVRPEAGQPLNLKVASGGTYRLVPVASTDPTEVAVEIPIFEGKKFEFELVEAKRPYLTRGNMKQFRSELQRQIEGDPRSITAWMSFHEEVTDETGVTRIRLRESARPLGPKTDEVVQAEYLAKSVMEMLSRGNEEWVQPSRETIERLLDFMVTFPMSVHYAHGWNLHAFETDPAIDLFGVTIEGPLEPIEDPDSLAAKRARQGLVGVPPGEAGSTPWLEHCVGIILEKAFRRTPSDSEKAAYRELAQQHLASGHTPEQTLNLLLRAALVSPHFLYREIQHGESLPLYALASRLSYLLTLAPPDALLLRSAADGSLAQREVVRSHALRLLGTTRVGEFAKSFSSQWLGTRALAQITPAPHLGAGFHLYGFNKEIEMFFAEMLTANRPLSDFIDPDFTFTNRVVGKQIYGFSMPEPAKGETDGTMVRVNVPRGGRRGGLLGMAGTMMATANGVDTQPVVRGKWLLENILGDQPPPPPPSVPAITPDTRGAKTIRDLMAAHTKEESCAGCHRKLDPPGFLLENFDAIGKWRDNYPVHTTGPDGKTVTTDGPAIDAAAAFPDGTAMRDITDLKRYVVAHIDGFAGCVAEKLFLYGTGRVPNYAERKKLRFASDRVLAEKGGFRDLLLAVVELEEFRAR